MSASSKPSDNDFVFRYDRILGEGSFSTVLLATDRRTGKHWAVKTMLRKQLVKDKMQDYAYRERNALNLLNARQWSPTDLVSSIAAGSQVRCASIEEEEEGEGEEENKAEDGSLEQTSDRTILPPSGQLQQQQQQQQRRQQTPRYPPSSATSSTSKKMLNPFFVQLFCSFKTPDRLFFVLTHAVNGEILQFLKKSGSFPVSVARFYLAEIVSAVHHLHSIGIIHRDLKPENILLGADMHILIADFGSCKILHHANNNAPSSASSHGNGGGQQQQQQQRTSISPTRCVPDPPAGSGGEVGPRRKSSFGETRSGSGGQRSLRPRAASFVGTPHYVSPEMLKGRPEEMASDLWALGCILYHFLVGDFPFRGATQHHIFKKIQALDFDFPPDFDPLALDLVRKLIVLDPAARLGSDRSGGFSALIRHPFFDSIDWETLHLQSPPLQPPEGKVLSLPSVTDRSPGFSEEAFARAAMDLEADVDDEEEEEEEEFELVAPKRRKSSATNPPASSLPLAVPLVRGKESGESDWSSPPTSHSPETLPSSPSPSSTLPKRASAAWTVSSSVPLILELLALSLEEKKSKREKQKRENVYHRLVQGNLILKSGILEKKRRAHYPTRKRMFLLTEGPNLFYVDPEKKELKGQVPWSSDMVTKYLSFKKFEIQTPNRTYDLLDPQGGAIDWCQCLDAVKEKFFAKTT